MLIPLFKGILVGLTLTISIGPGFLAIFQTAITRGVKAGLILAIGILISDLLLICASYFGLLNFLGVQNLYWFGLIGGLVLIIMGILSVIRKTAIDITKPEMIPNLLNSYPVIFLHGFIVNISNPLNLLFWISILGFAGSSFGINSKYFFVFLTGLILTAFVSDLFKCYLSGFLKNILNKKNIELINKIIGVILFTVGCIIILKFL